MLVVWVLPAWMFRSNLDELLHSLSYIPLCNQPVRRADGKPPRLRVLLTMVASLLIAVSLAALATGVRLALLNKPKARRECSQDCPRRSLETQAQAHGTGSVVTACSASLPRCTSASLASTSLAWWW